MLRFLKPVLIYYAFTMYSWKTCEDTGHVGAAIDGPQFECVVNSWYESVTHSWCEFTLNSPPFVVTPLGEFLMNSPGATTYI